MVSLSQLPWAWDPAPLVLGAAVVLSLRFVAAFRRLRRRGRTDHAGWSRAFLFVLGVLFVTLPLVSPLDAVGDDYLLSAHMLQHLLIGDAGPALLVVAVRGPLLAFMLPAPLVRFVFRHRLIRSVVRGVSRPAATVALWAAAMGVWHIPRLYDGALRHPWLHDFEHASFALAGMLVWMQLVDPGRTGHQSIAQRAAFAGVVFGLGQVLSDVLFLAPTALYPTYADRSVRLFGLSPLADQQAAGLVMMAEQLLTLGTCIVFLGVSPLRPARRTTRLAAV